MTSLTAFHAIEDADQLLAQIKKRLPTVIETDKTWWKKLAGVRGGNTWVNWELEFVQAATIRRLYLEVKAITAKDFAMISISRKRKNSEMVVDDDCEGDAEDSGKVGKVEHHLKRLTFHISGEEFRGSNFKVTERSSNKWTMKCPFPDCNKSYTSCICDKGSISSAGFRKHLSVEHYNVSLI